MNESSKVQKSESDDPVSDEIGISLWAWVVVGVFFVGGMILAWSLTRFDSSHWKLGLVLSLLVLMLSAVGFASCAKTTLSIRGDEIVYRGLCVDIVFHTERIVLPRKFILESSFRLSEIERVWVTTGYIHIKLKDGRHRMISNYFRDSRGLLASLQANAASNDSKT